jgi:hypothetical protein
MAAAAFTVLRPAGASIPKAAAWGCNTSRQQHRVLRLLLSSAAPAPAGRGFSTSAPRRTFSSYLVTPKEVHEALQKSPPSSISTDPRVICLSAAWFMPNDPEGRTGIESYRQTRIPKSRFFLKFHDSKASKQTLFLVFTDLLIRSWVFIRHCHVQLLIAILLFVRPTVHKNMLNVCMLCIKSISCKCQSIV